MGAAVLFPDAEAACATYLRSALAARGDTTTTIGTGKVPDPRPGADGIAGRYVHLRRLGGTRTTPVTDAAQMGFECWGPTAEEAHDIAQLCRALLLALAHTSHAAPVPVGRVDDLAGPAELPDMFSKQPRYVFSVVVHLRGAPLAAV